MEDQPTIRISVPKAKLASLSFCKSSPADLEAWTAALPMANTAQASQLVGDAVKEVAALLTTAGRRLALLEALRPSVHYLASRLDRAAVTQNQHTEAIGNVAQKLQTELSTGYKAVVRDALQELAKSRSVLKDTLPKAIHRTISDLSRQHLRTLQIYVNPPKETWLELNQLYLLAEKLELPGHCVEDAENTSQRPLSIADAYLRVALLSCSKPNQMRFRNLGRVFQALEHWASRVLIEPLQGDAIFAVDLAADEGPEYTALGRSMREPRGIRTDVLVYELEAYVKHGTASIPMPDFIDAALLQQLASAWGHMSQRSFKRLPIQGSLMVCAGLRNAHYYLSGGIPFIDQVSNTQTILRREINPFMEQTPTRGRHPSDDVWDGAFDLRVRIPVNPNIIDPDRILVKQAQKKPMGKPSLARAADGEQPDDGMQFFATTALDTSPGGYCVRWQEGLPDSLQTGELLAVREDGDLRWCVAVLRWIQQDSDGTITGLELMSPRAVPVAIRVIQKKGGPTDFARALLLPELKPIGQPATLITPKVPFATDQKIHLHRQGLQATAQLQEPVATTDSFNQFTFRMLDGYLENTELDLNIQTLSALIGDEEPSII